MRDYELPSNCVGQKQQGCLIFGTIVLPPSEMPRPQSDVNFIILFPFTLFRVMPSSLEFL